jgi:glycosyltransferase involved in cell wall biosynthesis
LSSASAIPAAETLARMHVTAVLPTWDNLAELEECLSSLERQTVQPTRILVCVDGSSDGTFAYLAQTAVVSKLIVLQHPDHAHRGRASTRNLALDHLEEGFVLFLDSDMRLIPTAIRAHLDVATRTGAVSVGRITYENARRDVWAGYLSRRGRNRWPDGSRLPFTQFTTANVLVSVGDVLALGGFDERFSGYGGEDIDFAYRLERRLGRGFVNNYAAEAITAEPKRWQTAIAQFESYGGNNLRLLMELHPDMPATFEVGRLLSSRAIDRAFVWSLNPVVGGFVRLLLRISPRALQVRLLNYEVIRAVFRGYRSGASH